MEVVTHGAGDMVKLAIVAACVWQIPKWTLVDFTDAV